MLVNVTSLDMHSPILRVMSQMHGGRALRNHSVGIYENCGFNFNNYCSRETFIDDFPDLGSELNCYGVADDLEQILTAYKAIVDDPNRLFCLATTPVEKSEQEEDGGWRWHKWGPYIGAQQPTCEYLHDEPLIERVLTFSFYEVNPDFAETLP